VTIVHTTLAKADLHRLDSFKSINKAGVYFFVGLLNYFITMGVKLFKFVQTVMFDWFIEIKFNLKRCFILLSFSF